VSNHSLPRLVQTNSLNSRVSRLIDPTRWQLLAGEVKKQDKYKQARLALGDVTRSSRAVRRLPDLIWIQLFFAINCHVCTYVTIRMYVGLSRRPRTISRTLACIADAAFDMDDCWRIAKQEWRPVYWSSSSSCSPTVPRTSPASSSRTCPP
jgi:hypothetical protein